MPAMPRLPARGRESVGVRPHAAGLPRFPARGTEWMSSMCAGSTGPRLPARGAGMGLNPVACARDATFPCARGGNSGAPPAAPRRCYVSLRAGRECCIRGALPVWTRFPHAGGDAPALPAFVPGQGFPHAGRERFAGALLGKTATEVPATRRGNFGRRTRRSPSSNGFRAGAATGCAPSGPAVRPGRGGNKRPLRRLPPHQMEERR